MRTILTLVVGTSTFSFPSGSFEEFSLEVLPYGFEATATVYVSSELDTDELFAPFTSDALIKATLSVDSCVLLGTEEDASVPPIVVTGYVVDKSLVEEASVDVAGMPIVGRSYQIRFADAAAVFWRQHHPLELHTGVSMQEVIDLHKVPGINVTYDWTRLGAKQDVLLVATGAESGVSFYDLVVWFIERHGGFFELDAATSAYRIAGTKARPSVTVELEREYTASLTSVLQEPARHKPRLHNSFTGSARTKVVDNTLAHQGVVQDVLLRTPLQADVDARQRIEAGRLKTSPPALRVEFARCPPQMMLPGMALKLGEDFSERMIPSGKSYRVTELRLQARAQASDDEAPELTDTAAPFEVTMSASLELASDPRPRLPRYTPPRYPVLVEGKVISEGGGAADRTWMMITDKQTSVARYMVKIPLWNKKVPVPFEPNHLPGHMFFPAYKDQRVLVALTFAGATIRRYLDWAANARTPLEGQGNRLVMGLQAINGVVVDHTYVDSKPVMSVKRTFGNDLQTLEIKEGVIFWEVREDESAAELTPKYDVSVVVTSAREQVMGAVQSAIGQVTGSFEASMGGASDHLDSSVEEVGGAVSAAEAKLTAKLEAVNAQLEAMSVALAASTDDVSAAVAAAKAELQALLK